MARTKQTARKTKPTPVWQPYQGGTVSSSEEEVEVESTITETQEEETAPTQERESSETAGPSRPSRKRKRGERTASSSLPSAESHRKTRKVAIVYSTDETDEDKIPQMEGEGYAFPRKTKEIKLTLPCTPSQVTLSRTFVEWFSFYGMRQGLREALESRHWTKEMINTFIANFREKHGFNRHTAMLPYNDENDSEEEPIHLEGGSKVVVRRRIISPKDSSTQEEDRLDDLVSKPKKRSAAQPTGESEPMAPPAKKARKEKKAKAAKPKKTAKPKKLSCQAKERPEKAEEKEGQETGGERTDANSTYGRARTNPRGHSRGRATAKRRSSESTTRGFTTAAPRRGTNSNVDRAGAGGCGEYTPTPRAAAATAAASARSRAQARADATTSARSRAQARADAATSARSRAQARANAATAAADTPDGSRAKARAYTTTGTLPTEATNAAASTLSAERSYTPTGEYTTPQRDSPPGESDPSPQRESLVTGTARREKVGTHPTEEEGTMEVMIAPLRHPLVVEVEVGTPATPLTETLVTVRVPGTRVEPMMTRSPRKSAVTEGWEQAVRQRDRMTIILETSHPKDPPHPSRDQGRSQPL